MSQMGKLSPLKLTRNALENAATIADLLIVTKAIIADIP